MILAAFHEPQVLLLDEPFDGVDPLGVEATMEVIADARARGAAVLVSTHLRELAVAGLPARDRAARRVGRRRAVARPRSAARRGPVSTALSSTDRGLRVTTAARSDPARDRDPAAGSTEARAGTLARRPRRPSGPPATYATCCGSGCPACAAGPPGGADRLTVLVGHPAGVVVPAFVPEYPRSTAATC